MTWYISLKAVTMTANIIGRQCRVAFDRSHDGPIIGGTNCIMAHPAKMLDNL